MNLAEVAECARNGGLPVNGISFLADVRVRIESAVPTRSVSEGEPHEIVASPVVVSDGSFPRTLARLG